MDGAPTTNPGGPSTIVIFGASGDLTKRKLIPALYNLRLKGRLPEGTRIVGYARRPYDHEEFRRLMREGVSQFSAKTFEEEAWDGFAANLYYARGDLSTPEDFGRLRGTLEELEGGPSDRLYYLATTPKFYAPVVENLGEAGMAGEEEGAAEGSGTATYGAAKLHVDNWRWQGVPFYLRSGKALAEKFSEIVIRFKSLPPSMFPAADGAPDGGGAAPNVLGLCLQPDEGVHLRFEAKVPGAASRARPVNMTFHYADAFGEGGIPDAYERLLLDAVHGDAALFIRSDAIELSWRLVDPILAAWERRDPARVLRTGQPRAQRGRRPTRARRPALVALLRRPRRVAGRDHGTGNATYSVSNCRRGAKNYGFERTLRRRHHRRGPGRGVAGGLPRQLGAPDGPDRS